MTSVVYIVSQVQNYVNIDLSTYLTFLGFHIALCDQPMMSLACLVFGARL